MKALLASLGACGLLIGAAIVIPSATIAPPSALKAKRPTSYAAHMVEAIPEEDRAATCPGGYSEQGTGAVCFADRDSATPSQAVVTEPAQRRRFVVCPSVEVDGAQTGITTRWLKPGDPMCPKGRLVATPNVTVTTGTDDDFVLAKRAACYPCPVTALSDGQCPACLLADGGCAAVCPVQEEVGP